jgi:hypothetical protein
VQVFTVPILILGFNRPDLLLGLVNSIRDLKPTKILVAIDGPRFNVENEPDLVRQCRSVVDEIDWSCEVTTLFRESNLGCGQAVSKAIEWAFTLVDELIVLEDDVRPSLDFYKFCEAGLSFYKNVENVMSIGGYNPVPTSELQKDILSAYPEIWGWATWKSKWKWYSFETDRSILGYLASILRANRFNPISSFTWTARFFSLKRGRVDTWDYQLVYAGFRHRKLHLISGTNQVGNVGFDPRATHTVFSPKVAPAISSTYSELIGEALYNEERDRLLRKIDKEQMLFSSKRYLAKYFKINM